MSTKSTIVSGKTFHFYHEMCDNEHVYLELEGTHFEAGYNRVMVPIPIHIWEVIRQKGGADISLAEKSDDELRIIAEQCVDDHVKRYQEAAEGSFLRKFYSDANRPRAEQIADHLESLIKDRQQQKEISAAIEEVKNFDPQTYYAQLRNEVTTDLD